MPPPCLHHQQKLRKGMHSGVQAPARADSMTDWLMPVGPQLPHTCQFCNTLWTKAATLSRMILGNLSPLQ